MSEQDKAVAIRTNGADLTHNQTRAVWAGAGSNALTPDVARALAIIGERYSLDPALGEILILGNKVYISLQGYLALAQRDARCEGISLVPLTDDERKNGKVAADEHAWKAEIWRKGWRVPAVGWGVASEKNIAAGPIKQFARELAEARAVRRALRLAFGFRIPDADEAVDLTTGEIVGNVPLLGMDAAEPKVTEIAPDWAKFWAHIKGLGVEHEEAHQVLRVTSMHDWAGSLDEAVTAIERYVLARDTEKAHPAVAQPAATPAKASKPSTRAEMIRRYQLRAEKAEELGLDWVHPDPLWSDEELRAAGTKLKAAIDAEEDRLFAAETASK